MSFTETKVLANASISRLLVRKEGCKLMAWGPLRGAGFPTSPALGQTAQADLATCSKPVLIFSPSGVDQFDSSLSACHHDSATMADDKVYRASTTAPVNIAVVK